MPPNDNGIVTSSLTKTYGDFKAVDSLSINIASGDIFGFLGPNGAGKTTTIRMLCGLLSPTGGSAKVGGFDSVKESRNIRSIVGVLPESSGYYYWMNAEEYLRHFAALYKIEEGQSRKRTRALLEMVGLLERAHVPIGYYSRGMKQRLGFARVLINDPKIIFLDEPTLGLDPKGQQDIQKIIFDLHKKGVTIFLCSHALNEVSSLCNNVAIVSHGKLIAQGGIDDLRKLAGGSNELLVRITNFEEIGEAALTRLPFRVEIKPEYGMITLKVLDPTADTGYVIDSLEKAGYLIYEVLRPKMSLEDIFLRLTETQVAPPTSVS
jgi:ABC-2 type transport system ATP-binding protein